MQLLQTLRENKRLVVGLVVAPLGLYTGIRIKDWRTERKVSEIQREVQNTRQPPPEPSESDEIRAELQNLRSARAQLGRQESLLNQELEGVLAKLKRLDAQDAKQEKDK
ncbi:hypothetical protein LPJ63_001676 [Coemansia sp. RSA 2711]|nr:hypothetical protein LPJ63_001676 [Coemansia sp. RSA 2711]KAJ2367351.1 hypothetical protein H4S01_002207 [Coemansia sp. RSA 2610]KAJ2385412.1 hypothetical protein H4S02_004342 [Coemansia sp. RSA 2611]